MIPQEPLLEATENTPVLANPSWSYHQAFSRNKGIVSAAEQDRLRRSRVAIAGLGGIGGIDLVTLARLGIGRFTIADPDVFEVANTNRQYGASQSTIGRLKAQVMAEIVRDINPEVDLRIFTDPIGRENASQFLEDADLFVDAIEFFDIDARRLLFRAAASRGIHAITAGPVGFSAVWMIFAPGDMTFDRYFDFSDDLDQLSKLVRFGVGIAPKATQKSYMDLLSVDPAARIGPSCSLACHLAAGALGCEATKILLERTGVRPAPYYHQFDPYVGRFAHGRIRGGNRHPCQRLKLWWLLKHFRARKEQSMVRTHSANIKEPRHAL